MTDINPPQSFDGRRNAQTFEVGGLRFLTVNRPHGSQLLVYGDFGKGWVILFEFSDYVDDPHYHAPMGSRYVFDRSMLGDPLSWWMSRVTGDLPEWLEEIGFGDLVPKIDLAAIQANAQLLIDAMNACIPEGYIREPGFGIRRIDSSMHDSALRYRNEQTLEFGGLKFQTFFDRDSGPSMVIWGEISGQSVELLRFDDYRENPHYHAPVGIWHKFDRELLGDPLVWFVDQVENHLEELLETSGFGSLLPNLDFAAISVYARSLYDVLNAYVPPGMSRVPGKGLQLV